MGAVQYGGQETETKRGAMSHTAKSYYTFFEKHLQGAADNVVQAGVCRCCRKYAPVGARRCPQQSSCKGGSLFVPRKHQLMDAFIYRNDVLEEVSRIHGVPITWSDGGSS